MNIINNKETHSVSGGYVNLSYENNCKLSRTTETRIIFTMQFDGSTPPEFQTRIDAGESFESMKADLRMYHTIRHMMKAQNPQLFSE